LPGAQRLQPGRAGRLRIGMRRRPPPPEPRVRCHRDRRGRRGEGDRGDGAVQPRHAAAALPHR
jgi:hypothetical protein